MSLAQLTDDQNEAERLRQKACQCLRDAGADRWIEMIRNGKAPHLPLL
jgi:hypothetical protein